MGLVLVRVAREGQPDHDQRNCGQPLAIVVLSDFGTGGLEPFSSPRLCHRGTPYSNERFAESPPVARFRLAPPA